MKLPLQVLRVSSVLPSLVQDRRTRVPPATDPKPRHPQRTCSDWQGRDFNIWKCCVFKKFLPFSVINWPGSFRTKLEDDKNRAFPSSIQNKSVDKARYWGHSGQTDTPFALKEPTDKKEKHPKIHQYNRGGKVEILLYCVHVCSTDSQKPLRNQICLLLSPYRKHCRCWSIQTIYLEKKNPKNKKPWCCKCEFRLCPHQVKDLCGLYFPVK